MIDVSIVIPAYNEEKRLPAFLDQVAEYCNKSTFDYEVIVVDDGSVDRTLDIANSYKERFSFIDVVRIRKNRGKGYAVKRGSLRARGNICVFLDADGSVHPSEIERNMHYLTTDKYDVFVGSRVLSDDDQVLETKWYRKLMGRVFNFCVQLFLFKNVRDTQCGFKMFKKDSVRPIFSRGYLRGFGFDIEILYLAHKMGYKVKEGAVSWHHVSGSKVNILFTPFEMFLNILQVRNWHCTPINTQNKYLGPDEYQYMYNMENYHWWFVSHTNLAVDLIRDAGISSPDILDVGTGTGASLVAFNKLGKAYGVDISEKAIEFCRKRGLDNVVLSSAEKIAYPDRAFDVVVAMDLLEHLDNPIVALGEMNRVLRDDGMLLIMVPAFPVLWSQHDEALCHLRRYTKEALLLDLNEAGFDIDSINYYYFASFFAVAPIRILRRMQPKQMRIHCDTTTLPPKILNEFLKFLFKLERKVSSKITLPFGTTIYCVAHKKVQ